MRSWFSWTRHLNLGTRNSHRATSKSHRSATERRLAFEVMEDRRVMSVIIWNPVNDIEPWEQGGGNAGHSGYVNTAFDPGELDLVWNQPQPLGDLGSFNWNEIGVAVDRLRVYRTHRVQNGESFAAYTLTAYDLQFGHQLWQRTLAGAAHAGVGEPSLGGTGMVYVNRAGHSGNSGESLDDWPRLLGINSHSGDIWLEQTYSSQWGSSERPVIADGQVVAESGYYGGMSAFTANTLTREWFVENGALESPRPALDDEYVYAFNNHVYRRATGERLTDVAHASFQYEHEPIVSDSGKVLYSLWDSYPYPQAFAIVAFDGNTHAELWTTPIGDRIQGKAVGNGIVAVTAGRDLILLDESTGALIRSWHAPNALTSEIALSRSHAFVQSTNGFSATVHAVDLATGQDVWSFSHSAHPPYVKLALIDQVLVLSGTTFVRTYSTRFSSVGAVSDVATTREDESVAVAVLANDTSPSGHPFAVTSATSFHGTVLLHPDGTITYTPDANHYGPDSVFYRVDDGHGNTDTASVFITVVPTNDSPAVAPSVFTLRENSANGALVGSVSATDIDSNALSYSVTGVGAEAFTIDAATGLIRVANKALLDFETQPLFLLTVNVSDGSGGVTTANVRIRLTDVFEVSTDILPGYPANRISRNAREIEVAILSTAKFNAGAQIDLRSLRLRRIGSTTSAAVISDSLGRYRYTMRDVNGDGRRDLVVKFNLSKTGLLPGLNKLRLTGKLLPKFGSLTFRTDQAARYG
jgi:hypothetical protein